MRKMRGKTAPATLTVLVAGQNGCKAVRQAGLRQATLTDAPQFRGWGQAYIYVLPVPKTGYNGKGRLLQSQAARRFGPFWARRKTVRVAGGITAIGQEHAR